MADDPRAAARQRLASIIDKVPPGIAAAGQTTTETYKKAVVAARKAMKNQRATLLALQQAYTSLQPFWRQA